MRDKKRFNLIKKSFDSLVKTIDISKIIVSDDGSELKDHIEYIKSLGIKVIERQTNGGYAKNSNTLIKWFMDNGYNFRFMADDDNVYEQGWEEQYAEAIEKTGYHHWNLWLSYLTIDHSQRPYGDIVEDNGYKYRKTPLVNGCFQTLSRAMIDKIGYLNEMTYKNGHEHSFFTQRAIDNGFAPGYIDVLEPKVNNLQILDTEYIVSDDQAYNQDNLEKNGEIFKLDKKAFYHFHD